jgi:hypothetical protein
MDERGIPERLENGNVLEPREPTFAIVGQENETVTMKYVWLVFLFRNPIWFFKKHGLRMLVSFSMACSGIAAHHIAIVNNRRRGATRLQEQQMFELTGARD